MEGDIYCHTVLIILVAYMFNIQQIIRRNMAVRIEKCRYIRWLTLPPLLSRIACTNYYSLIQLMRKSVLLAVVDAKKCSIISSPTPCKVM